MFHRNTPSHKDDLLTIIAIVILFLTALFDWSFETWLILAAVILILFAWYIRSTSE